MIHKLKFCTFCESQIDVLVVEKIEDRYRSSTEVGIYVDGCYLKEFILILICRAPFLLEKNEEKNF